MPTTVYSTTAKNLSNEQLLYLYKNYWRDEVLTLKAYLRLSLDELRTIEPYEWDWQAIDVKRLADRLEVNCVQVVKAFCAHPAIFSEYALKDRRRHNDEIP